jgi:hypothetical protein
MLSSSQKEDSAMAGSTLDPNEASPERKRKTLTLRFKLANLAERADGTDRSDDSAAEPGLRYTQQDAEEDDRGLH